MSTTTADDVYRAKSAEQYKAIVKEWARTAWDA
ncbi:hypothetical protein [Marinomonas sp. THO17]